MGLSAAIAFVLVLAAIYGVPVIVYGVASRFVAVAPPANVSPGRFMAGVLVTKAGTAAAFVGLYAMTATLWNDRWIIYATLWFVVFAASELGDLIAKRTTRNEAMLGIAAEAVYSPLSAWIVAAVIARTT